MGKLSEAARQYVAVLDGRAPKHRYTLAKAQAELQLEYYKEYGEHLWSVDVIHTARRLAEEQE